MIRERLLNWVVKHLFNGITKKDIFQIKDGEIYYRERPLKEDQKQRVIERANVYKEDEFWKMLRREVRYQANRKMYYKSKDWQDMFFSKAALWAVEIMEKKVDDLSQL